MMWFRILYVIGLLNCLHSMTFKKFPFCQHYSVFGRFLRCLLLIQSSYCSCTHSKVAYYTFFHYKFKLLGFLKQEMMEQKLFVCFPILSVLSISDHRFTDLVQLWWPENSMKNLVVVFVKSFLWIVF